MWTRGQLKSNARINMKRNYWSCVAVAFIMSILEGAGAIGGARNGSQSAISEDGHSFESYHSMEIAVPAVATAIIAIVAVLLVFGILLNIFIGNVLRIGANKFFVQNRTEIVRTGTIFDGFRSGHYGNIVGDSGRSKPGRALGNHGSWRIYDIQGAGYRGSDGRRQLRPGRFYLRNDDYDRCESLAVSDRCNRSRRGGWCGDRFFTYKM